MLSVGSVAAYLLQAGLLQPSHLVERGLTIRDLSRRNRVFGAAVPDGPSYLLKQGADDGRAPLAHEAHVLEHLARCGALALRTCVPRVYAYDAPRDLLVLEYFVDAPSLREQYERHQRCSIATAESLAESLAALHDDAADWLDERPGETAQAPVPWVLSVHRPGLRTLARISRANLELIRTVQRAEAWCTALDALSRRWRPAGLAHLDLKWDNCLAGADGPIRRPTAVRIIDWELARRGDPCWDVGAIFSEYLGLWASSVAVGNDRVSVEAALRVARYPLDRLQPAVRRFWRSYVTCRGLAALEAERSLLRAVEYCGARLLQSTYEQLQQAAQLPANAHCLLQLSANLLQRPAEAAAHLLGIPLRHAGVRS